MTAGKRVALVSAAGDSRTALAGYLRSAGFEVHECAELAAPASFGALVAIDGHETANEALAAVRSWMKPAKTQRIVVVTPKPTAFKDLLATYGDRLVVLPAPAFGWDVVDALRTPPGPGPRGA